jgi:hypothetical protein
MGSLKAYVFFGGGEGGWPLWLRGMREMDFLNMAFGALVAASFELRATSQESAG